MTTDALAGRPTARRRLPDGLNSTWRRTTRFFRQKPLGAFGAVLMVVFILVAVFAELVAPYSALEHSNETLAGPSMDHFAGTDQYGRDVFSRLVFGARTSLFVGVGATVLSMIPAVALGIASAYIGGRFDYAVQRFVDTIQALPALILLITILVVLGPGLWNMIFALSFNRAVSGSRVMRGASMSVTNETYVEAARTLGATSFRIMLRHVLPNIVPTVIVVYSLGFGTVILAEASLSFLGLGVPPPTPSWGGMLAADGRAYMFAAPWMLWTPMLVLAIVVFAVNMFGDALRDVLDPRLRGAR